MEELKKIIGENVKTVLTPMYNSLETVLSGMSVKVEWELNGLHNLFVPGFTIYFVDESGEDTAEISIFLFENNKFLYEVQTFSDSSPEVYDCEELPLEALVNPVPFLQSLIGKLL